MNPAGTQSTPFWPILGLIYRPEGKHAMNRSDGGGYKSCLYVYGIVTLDTPVAIPNPEAKGPERGWYGTQYVC